MGWNIEGGKIELWETSLKSVFSKELSGQGKQNDPSLWKGKSDISCCLAVHCSKDRACLGLQSGTGQRSPLVYATRTSLTVLCRRQGSPVSRVIDKAMSRRIRITKGRKGNKDRRNRVIIVCVYLDVFYFCFFWSNDWKRIQSFYVKAYDQPVSLDHSHL